MEKKKQNEEPITIQDVGFGLLVISTIASFYAVLIHFAIILWEEGLWYLTILISIIMLSIAMLLIGDIIKNQE